MRGSPSLWLLSLGEARESDSAAAQADETVRQAITRREKPEKLDSGLRRNHHQTLTNPQPSHPSISPVIQTKSHPQATRTGAIAMSAGQGSSGNVIAALCSFFIPGLGQLVQGRMLMALLHFVLASLLWLILLGWIVHLWSIIDAAMFKPR